MGDLADLWAVGGKQVPADDALGSKKYCQHCPDCGWQLTGKFSTCPRCGADLRLQTCSYCRGEIPLNAEHCMHCTAPLS